MHDVDVAIVGGGPIGIELNAALSNAGRSVAHFEAGGIGHTFAWWAPGTKFFSSPERIAVCGVPLSTPDQGKVTGEVYRSYLVDVVKQFSLDVRTFMRVEEIERTDSRFVLSCRRSAEGVGGPSDPGAGFGEMHKVNAAQVVLAIGNMHRGRLIGCQGEDLPNVSHYLEDVTRYFGRRVVIVGGKNSAAEAAIRLYRAGAHVTICYRQAEFDTDRIKYWVLPELEWLIEKGRISFMPGTNVVRVTAEEVELDSGERVEADDVLMLTGYLQNRTLFDQLGVELTGEVERPVLDRTTMESSVPGVYLAGTACGGSQNRAKVFIENSHVHVDRICRAIAGQGVPWELDDVLEGLGKAHEEQ
ncbi:MAG: NAD(P)-binding domain-containing protein [Phycisphaerales bacterium]